MIGLYPGDKKFAEVLTLAGCEHSVGEIRALLAGAILGVDMVNPSTIYENLDFGATGPTFADEGAAKDFFQATMSLWNEIAKHQEPERPFSFSPIPASLNTIEEWIDFGNQRVFEAELFLLGSDLSNTPFRSQIEGVPESEVTRCLLQNIADLSHDIEFAVEDLELEKTEDCSKLRGLIERMDRKVIELYPGFIRDVREWRGGALEEIPEPHVNPDPKVGRNDRCPCGSGKKFKHCCLQ